MSPAGLSGGRFFLEPRIRMPTNALRQVLGRAALAALLTSASAQGADLAAGQKKAEVCAACHGAQGISTLPDTPSLAGQPDAFVQWQLVYFRSGVRKNPVMAALVAGLTDDDVRNLGAYYASLPPPRAIADAADPANVKQAGATVVSQNRCASCHGDDFAGKQAAARLAFQHEAYLLKALRDFKSGARTGGGVGAMPDAVYPLSDEQLKVLAHYLASDL
jgi:cytochrome c553